MVLGPLLRARQRRQTLRESLPLLGFWLGAWALWALLAWGAYCALPGRWAALWGAPTATLAAVGCVAWLALGPALLVIFLVLDEEDAGGASYDHFGHQGPYLNGVGKRPYPGDPSPLGALLALSACAMCWLMVPMPWLLSLLNPQSLAHSLLSALWLLGATFGSLGLAGLLAIVFALSLRDALGEPATVSNRHFIELEKEALAARLGPASKAPPTGPRRL